MSWLESWLEVPALLLALLLALYVNILEISKAKISVSLIQTTSEIYAAYLKRLWNSKTYFFRQCSLNIYWFHKYDNK